MASKFTALIAFTAASLLAPLVAHAGPPLICHPYAIGTAKSLPGGGDWHGVDKHYDRKTLVPDTLALLTPDAPILVRMETLRRAALYATSQLRAWDRGSNGYTAEDRALGLGLLEKLQARTKDTSAAAPQRALALFDAGFFAETLRQTSMNPGIDGFALLTAAAQLRGADPEMDFALAVASVHPERKEHRDYLARARAAAKDNRLLAANLASHFGTKS